MKVECQKLLPVNLPVPEPNLVELNVRPLRAAGIRYLIAASFGSMRYSEPRLTLDIDIPLLITVKEIPIITASFT